jgi:hypothetical protein
MTQFPAFGFRPLQLGQPRDEVHDFPALEGVREDQGNRPNPVGGPLGLEFLPQCLARFAQKPLLPGDGMIDQPLPGGPVARLEVGPSQPAVQGSLTDADLPGRRGEGRLVQQGGDE